MYKFFLFILITSLYGLPTAPEVVSGTATISSTGGEQTITASSDRTIIEWFDFSCSNGESVTFTLPNTTSAILNRVTGSNQSVINGLIASNGQVFLVNTNGVLVGPTGNIHVASLLVSNINLSNADFLAGNPLQFSGSPSTQLENQGILQVDDDFLVLVGSRIVNSGEIRSSNYIGMAAGRDIAINTSTQAITITPVVDTPALTGIAQSGIIEGKTIDLEVDGNLYELAINLTGSSITRAKRDATNSAMVRMIGVGGGTVRVEDQSAILSSNLNSTGGSVIVSADIVELQGQATISTKMDLGGGTILIGGGIGGGDPNIINASTVDIGENVRLFANARYAGDGGTTSVYATGQNTFLGRIDVRGGIASGSGGMARLDNIANLNQGTIFFRAPRGLAGMIIRNTIGD